MILYLIYYREVLLMHPVLNFNKLSWNKPLQVPDLYGSIMHFFLRMYTDVQSQINLISKD